MFVQVVSVALRFVGGLVDVEVSPHQDPKSFVEMGMLIETVVTSTYNGAIPFISDKVCR